jgi:acetyl esterase/lipase
MDSQMRFKLLLVSVLAITPALAQETDRRPTDPSISAEQRVANWLSQQDPNEDGKISLDESTGLMKSNFRRNDANRDGFLDRDELVDLAKRLARGTGRNRRQPTRGMTDEQVRGRTPEGVTVELNIPYRQGNDAWKLDLAMPAKESSSPRPAIVFIHGGGWTSGDKRTAAFIGPALDYSAKGYVCISVNYRLERTLRCIEDVKCAVRWLRAHADKYNIDPDRIGAYGNSAGAHLVTMLGVSHTEKRLEGDGPWQEYPSSVQAVAASATPTHPRWVGTSDEERKLAAPMTFVTADAPPFLLFHEESDRTVDIGNSDDFVKALEEAGATDVTYKRYTDGSGHGVFRKNIEETGAAMEKFFARTIGL